MKTNTWLIVVPLAAGALLWNPAQGLAEDRQQEAKRTLHRKSQPMAVERPSPDRMSRHERQLIQARLAAGRRSSDRKSDRRALDQDFDRIEKRFGGVYETGQWSAMSPDGRGANGQWSAGAALPSGTILRDSRSGQVFIVE